MDSIAEKEKPLIEEEKEGQKGRYLGKRGKGRLDELQDDKGGREHIIIQGEKEKVAVTAGEDRERSGRETT